MNNELYHHGVKGMKWGIRHDPERSSGTPRKYTARQQAKKDLRAAKKAYRKNYNKWYFGSYNPANTITDKGRRKHATTTFKMLKSVSDLAIAKGKYKQAKGIEKSNPKLVAKGKKQVELGRNSKTYYSDVLKYLDKGYDRQGAVSKANKTFQTAKNKENDIRAKYRSQYGV